MAVDVRHRRRGIARALLGVAETYCSNFGYLTLILSTSELQTPAMRLYESSAYRLVRKDDSAGSSHKSVGAGLTRYHYQKPLGDAAGNRMEATDARPD